MRPAVYDGDTPVEEREWVRQYANYVLTNPDMLHRGILPSHPRWSSFLRALRYVVIDECHTYRGVFGSHVAQVLRRLRRLCARYGANPVFLLASATAAEPAVAAGRLTGLPVREVADDASPRGELVFALWEPPLTDLHGEKGAPVRRTATAETADLLTDLTVQGVRTVAFVRSRRGAELISVIAQERLAEVDRSLARRVAAYRGGYLPEERRALERALHSGELLGLAATTALELGIDVSGLDAVLISGYPGTRASLWQQAGRAGRSGQGALADPGRPRRPAGHLPRPPPRGALRPAGRVHRPRPRQPVRPRPAPVRRGRRAPADRRRPGALRPGRRRAAPAAGGREAAAPPYDGLALDAPGAGRRPRRHPRRGRPSGPDRRGRHRAGCSARSTSRAAHTAVHEGAVHLHQGRTYLVQRAGPGGLGRPGRGGRPPRTRPPPATPPPSPSWRPTSRVPWGDGRLCYGSVEVTNQVVSFLRRRLITGEVLGETKLDLPPRTLRTRAVWWTVTEDQLDAARVNPEILGGALHAAEHASIGMLPLFATCDRWDIGGVSVPLHPDTLLPTVFVYDGHPGGAGFAERAFHTAREWLTATREAIASCECDAGCPSCIQSPKCGNGNDPLHKRGAVRLLTVLLKGAPEEPARTDAEEGDGPAAGLSAEGRRADGDTAARHPRSARTDRAGSAPAGTRRPAGRRPGPQARRSRRTGRTAALPARGPPAP